MIFQYGGFQFFQAGLAVALRAANVEIDTSTLKRLEELSRLPDDAKKQVFLVVDALIRDFKAKQAYAS